MNTLPALTRRYLSRREASEYLTAIGVPAAIRTLAKLAVYGQGPAFHKAGRSVRYPIESLDTWARERLGPLRRSTSDTKVQVSG